MPSSFRVKNHPDFLGVKCIGILYYYSTIENKRRDNYRQKEKAAGIRLISFKQIPESIRKV